MKTKLDQEINIIHHVGLRMLTRATLDAAPACFWSMPAATTGKYHPAISLGEGGLVRHTQAVVRLALHLLNMLGIDRTLPAHSIAVAAAILHDCAKKDDGEQWTAFDHPLRAVRLIEATASTLEPGIVQPQDLRRLCGCVAAHMGRWNTNPKSPGVELPLPETPLQRLVHTADYLASRKDLTLDGIK